MKPAKDSIKAFRQEMKVTFKLAQQWPTQQVISRVNPITRGWCNHFRIGSSKYTFALLDAWMWVKLKRFVQRRHPHKSWQWRCDKYWGKIPKRNDKWVFMDKKSQKYLTKLSWTPTKRHILVKGKSSPDNPKLREYWRKRHYRKLRLCR